jgi:spermidine synthase
MPLRTEWRRACGLLLAGLAMCLPAQAQQLVHVERSLYRNIFVYEREGQNNFPPDRCMQFTRNHALGRQTCIWPAHPELLYFNYTRAMLGALSARPASRRILAIGLGGGTLPMALARTLPEASIDAVELDPAVVRVAQDYFGFRPSPTLRVHVEDGRVFVRRALAAGQRYDMVMLDAFDLDYVPEHLLTREFFQQLRRLLVDDGVLVANTFSRGHLYGSESATYEAVFGRFYNLKIGYGSRVVLAKMDGLPAPETIARNAQALAPRFAPTGLDINWLLPLLDTRRDWDVSARVLTDQYSPSNLLDQ